MNIPGSQLSMSISLYSKEWLEIMECLMDLCTDMHGVMACHSRAVLSTKLSSCRGRPKCVLCECLGPSSNLGNAVICRDFSVPFFVRKNLRHQSALAYALAKAQVEELKPGAGG